jgi:hypothetical protein
MCCEDLSDRLTAHLEASPAEKVEDLSLLEHLAGCESCRGRLAGFQVVRDRLAAAARALPEPSLEAPVMAAIRMAGGPGRGAAARSAGWRRVVAGGATWRWRLATAACGGLVLALILLWPFQGTQAWSIEQSIAATRPLRALRLSGTLGGSAECQLWARSSSDGARSNRLLIRINDGPTIWTDGNATYTLEPRSRVVQVDDAQTANFNPWPGARLFELVKRVGVRTVDTRWHFPARRGVVVEWSLMSAKGPTSAVAEFDVESKLLVAFQQWDNMDRHGPAGFEARDIAYFDDLPDSAFAVELPDGVTYHTRDVEVAQPAVGLLSLADAGVETSGLEPGEAGRRTVKALWDAILARDFSGLRKMCPLMRTWTDQALSATLGNDTDADAVVEVLEIRPGVTRGHSSLGPLSVVASRVRHRDGGIYEEKMIVQHRPSGPAPSCVVYSIYGQPYRIE